MDPTLIKSGIDNYGQQYDLKYEVQSELNNCTCRAVHDDVNTFNVISIVIFLPILSTLGLMANAINIWIYSKTKSSAERYLMALSISDFGVCASGILVITADSMRAHNFSIDQLLTVSLPKLIPFLAFFQMLSIYITVMAAVDCYIKVSGCFTTKLHNYCTITNANRILVGVFFITAVYNVIQFGELEAVKCFAPDLRIELYELCPTALRLDEFYITVYRGYLYAAIMAVVPFLLLSVLTALIIFQLRRRKNCKILKSVSMEKFHDYVVINEQIENSKPVEADTGSPIMLVLVVILFLSCSFVSLLVNICDMFEDLLSHEVQMALIDVGNVLVVFNATANFIIYACSSSYFRSQVLKLFGVDKKVQADVADSILNVVSANRLTTECSLAK